MTWTSEWLAIATWRERNAWAQTQGRQLDRIAGDIRPRLGEFVSGASPDLVLASIASTRKQLDLIEEAVRGLALASSASGRYVPPRTLMDEGDAR